MKHLFALLLALASSAVWPVQSTATYYAQLIYNDNVDGTWGYKFNSSATSGFYAGKKSECLASPYDAVVAAGVPAFPWTIIQFDAYGNFIAKANVYGYYTNSYQMTVHGIYIECTSATSGGSDPAAAIAAQNTAIASLQTTVATNQTAVSTLNSALATNNATVTTMQSGLQTLLNAQGETFDLETAMKAFAFFFSSVIIFYALGKGGGAVLRAINQRH